MKSFASALLIAGATAQYFDGPTRNNADYQHDRVWGHGHYEPGEITRFDNHYAEIYGSDDLAWGPNGFQNPHTHNDDVHNWDDQGDANTCHACGGHGCTLCGGYGHVHRNAAFGNHGHNLKTGFGVGHNHAYLGDKVRSSYNRYGHGVGGRYTQRWTNGYGNRYGIGHGHRYGLAHRWGMYNGYGHGNPSSKGSVMGYGIGANAAIPQQWDDQYQADYGYEEPEYGYEQEYGYDEPEYGYEDEYTYEEPDYGYEQEYEEYEEPEYGYEDEYTYEEPDYGYEQEYEEYEEPEECYYEMPQYEKVEYTEDEYKQPTAMNGYKRGMGMSRRGDRWAADGFGSAWWQPQKQGRGHYYTMDFGLGAGNHSPWNEEIYRHDAGQTMYLGRPRKSTMYHVPAGYGNNMWF